MHPQSPTSIYGAQCFYFFVLPAKCIHRRAKMSSGKSESQQLSNRLDTCLCEELLKSEIFFVTEVHLLHRFLIQIFFSSQAARAANFVERSL